MLTAYALGELDAATFKAVEEALKDRPELQRDVDEILRAGALLSQELAEEQGPVLEPAQRAAIETAAQGAVDKVVPFSWARVAMAGGLAAAACLLLALGLRIQISRDTGDSASHLMVHSRAAVSNAAAARTNIALSPRLLAKNETQPMPAVVAPLEEVLAETEKGSAPETVYRMDPRLMDRYGLRPVAPTTGRVPSPNSTVPPAPSAAPGEVYSRYGLAPRQMASAAPAASRLEDAIRGPVVPGGARRYAPSPAIHPSVSPGPGTALYPKYLENVFRAVLEHPLSTFSVDVDTASYANVRRFLNQGQRPPPDAVRIEEMLNYFSYDYAPPRGGEPFSIQMESADCPWAPEHRLVRIGLQASTLRGEKRPPCNLVFLIDVSGSMQPEDRLPLIKQALRALAKRMNESDRISIVVYASQSRVVLPSTSCEQKAAILEAIDGLEADGSTNGGQGIQTAYRIAAENLIRGGVNRVILCTDGDFNVGMTEPSHLIELVQRQAKTGVFLTTLGVGMDNYNDALMQRLADKGNGNYHYLDSFEEAQKVLSDQLQANLVTVAKDVKIQVEFNPAQVLSYRLIGYEKRRLRAQDFEDDSKDAGEVGAGHAVTVLYEIVPAGEKSEAPVTGLKYQRPARPVKTLADASGELLTVKLRYKQPSGDQSRMLEWPFLDNGQRLSQASADTQFVAAVASFGMLLQDSSQAGSTTFNSVISLAEQGKGPDKDGSRAEFVNLVKKAKQLVEPVQRPADSFR